MIRGLYARVSLGEKDGAHRLVRVETLHTSDEGTLVEVQNMRKPEKLTLDKVTFPPTPIPNGFSRLHCQRWGAPVLRRAASALVA